MSEHTLQLTVNGSSVRVSVSANRLLLHLLRDAKTAGEVTNCGVAPAIANAVHDAVGARVFELPLTAERVLSALHDSSIG